MEVQVQDVVVMVVVISQVQVVVVVKVVVALLLLVELVDMRRVFMDKMEGLALVGMEPQKAHMAEVVVEVDIMVEAEEVYLGVAVEAVILFSSQVKIQKV